MKYTNTFNENSKFEIESNVMGNLEYPNISHIEDIDKASSILHPEIIRFYVYVSNNKSVFTCKYGMTFEEYINSSYNTNFKIENNKVYHTASVDIEIDVTPSTIIEHRKTYYVLETGWD